MSYNVCCFMQDEDAIVSGGASATWPPDNPPLLASHGGLTLVRGYLKRKSSKPGEAGRGVAFFFGAAAAAGRGPSILGCLSRRGFGVFE